MLRIAVCDDNELQREMLLETLDTYLEQRGLTISPEAFSDGNALLACVRESGPFDLYILDLIMPGMNGMEVASTLRMLHDDGIIIFLTSTVDYALASYDVNAFHYLLKPLDSQKLYSVLDRALDQLDKAEEQAILVRTREGETRILLKDLQYVDLNNRALHYHLLRGGDVDGLVIRVSFREAVAPILRDKRFVLCGLSMVVNLTCIDQMDCDSVLMNDGTLLYPSKNACTALRREWTAYHKVDNT